MQLRTGLLAFALAFIPAASGAAGAITPEQILTKARDASGGDWSREGVLRLEGRDHVKGIDTSWSSVIDTASGRTRESRDFGLFRTIEVWDGRTHWSSGRSGGVHPLNSPFARKRNITEAWLARRGYFKPHALGAKLRMLGTRSEDGRTYTALLATPPHGADIELWFDDRDHRLARSMLTLATTVHTVRYDDYRPVSGLFVPFKVTVDEGDAANADNIGIEHAAFAAETPNDFQPPASPQDFSVPGGKSVVPIQYDGFVAVDVMLNGKGPFAFILDTAGHAILTPETAKALALDAVGNGNTGGAGANTRAFQFAKVDCLDIGTASLRNVAFAVVPLGFDTIERGAAPPFAGILGVELFERFAIRLDYRRQQLTLQPLATYRHAGPGRAIPIAFEDDEPIVTGRIDGTDADMSIDTGFPEPLTVQGIWAGHHNLTQRLRGFPLQGFGGMGGDFALWASRADVEIAGTTIPRVVSYFAEDKKGSLSSRTLAGIIGNAVLANFTVEFDYRRGQLWLERLPASAPAPFDRSGLSVEKEKREAFTIGSVTQGTPASDAGLKIGDEIIAIDGRPSADLAGWDFGRLMRRPVGTVVHVTIMRDGKSMDVTFTLRDVLP